MPLLDQPGPAPDTPIEDVLLAVGVVSGTHGVSGDLKVKPYTDFPEHLGSVDEVLIGDHHVPYDVIRSRIDRDTLVLTLAGVDSMDDAENLRGMEVRIFGVDAVALEPGEFFYYQVLGLTVVSEIGNPIGMVSDILDTGANAVFSVSPDGGGQPVLIPYIPEVVLDIDPVKKLMVVRPLDYRED